MQKPKSFVMDTRNVGGRQHVIETMLAHQSKLRQIVSSERSARPGSATFSAPPKSFDMSRKLSLQRSRKQARALNEQDKADQNMLRRMDSYPLPAQRKQNPHDPVTHPVKLFRDPDDPHRPHAYAADANGGLALPASPRRLYSAEGMGGTQMRPVSAGVRGRSSSPRRNTGLPPSGSGSHAGAAFLTADHYASALPRGSGSEYTVPGQYKRASKEIMEYTSGGRVARRATATDSDELEPGYGRPGSRSMRPASASASAYPSSAGVDLTPYAEHASRHASDLERAAADGTSTGLDPYTTLRHKLFALIVEHRIFREQAILKLLHKAKQINAHMNQAKLDRVLEDIKIEFEIDPRKRIDDPHGFSGSRGNGGASHTAQQLERQRAELASLSRDVREDALQGKLDRLEREREDRLDREDRERDDARRSRHRSRSHSRSRSPSRSRSNSPRGSSAFSSADNSARRSALGSSRDQEEEF